MFLYHTVTPLAKAEEMDLILGLVRQSSRFMHVLFFLVNLYWFFLGEFITLKKKNIALIGIYTLDLVLRQQLPPPVFQYDATGLTHLDLEKLSGLLVTDVGRPL